MSERHETLPGAPVAQIDSSQDLGRLLAFSDGVFAFAITLLVLTLLGLRLPNPSAVTPASLIATLGGAWPTYLTYVISFATILIMWVYHHRLFQSVTQPETVLLFSNGLLLLLVTVVPFPTSLVGTYLRTPAAWVACAAYAGFFALIDAAYNLLWWVVVRQQASGQRRWPRPSPSMLISFLGFPCYVVAALAAALSPFLTLAICAALWVVWAVTAHRLQGELLAARADPHDTRA
jgi:uncharacterized membrane protein